MIIMINGAFGVGKTTVANELLHKLDGAMLFDPELVGFMLRHIVPEHVKHAHEQTGDFQDLDMWKSLTVEVAKHLRATYGKDLIVPMTIYNKRYFNSIYDGFLEIDPQTVHFCLLAEKETIHARLRARGEEDGNWCFDQTEKCIKGFQDFDDHHFIQTDDVSIEEIVEFVCNELKQEVKTRC